MAVQITTQLLYASFISLIVALLALWRGSLSRSGALGALVIGTATFGLGGWTWGVLLGVFFVSSSLLSHYKEDEKVQAAEKFDKGHQRDFAQAIANGGAGAMVATLSVLYPSPAWFILFVGVMATVTADTWATELGTLSHRPPRLITNFQTVEVGTSGAISALGTAVSLLAGALIGLVAGGLTPSLGATPMLIVGGLSGLSGSLVDSLLGATVQQVYFCEACQKETERRRHKCGTVTRSLRGYGWFNNDLVNFLSSLVGGGIAIILIRLVS